MLLKEIFLTTLKKHILRFESIYWRIQILLKDISSKIEKNMITSYKSFLDEMYYLDQYTRPDQAIVFNAYLAAYEKTIGMMTSTGCKSGNDRTYVARLFLAAMENRDLAQFPLPEEYHFPPKSSQTIQKTELFKRMNAIAHTDAAAISPIIDNGAPPKVSASKFSVLKGIQGIKFVGDKEFGEKYATHKMKKMITEIVSYIKTLFSSSSN